MSETQKRKVLLIYPDFTSTENRKDNYGSYSEGLASISAVLKQGGHQVALYHLTYMPDKQEYIDNLKKHSDADIIGFTLRTSAFPEVKILLEWTKEALPSSFILFGGYHPTLAPDEVIGTKNVDAVCIGEGEYAMLEMCDSLGTDALYSIQNLWFKKPDGTIIKNPVRPCIENLEDLPLPDYDLFDYDNLLSSRMKTALVMVSRGCIFSCTYCGNSKLREVYPNREHYARFRSPENAISLLKTLLEKYPYIKYFNFRDAILNMKKEWFNNFIELYKQEIHMPFTGNLRLDLLDEDTIKRLAEAGCYMLDVGIESGDYEMRKKYLHRNMTDEQIISSFKFFRKYGIISLTYNIVGLPYEDLKLALKTVKLNALIRPDRSIANVFTPFPMTRLTEIAKEGGFLPDVLDFKRKVFLVQPQFPESQVLFVEAYFSFFQKLYQVAWKMPKPFSKATEHMLDAYFTTKYKPHGFLVALSNAKDNTKKGMKRVLLKANPKLYLKLRDSRVMRKQAAVKKAK
jgi:anaerobic magnesium-protoporphyrin IX monomethyl ester cyclase